MTSKLQTLGDLQVAQRIEQHFSQVLQERGFQADPQQREAMALLSQWLDNAVSGGKSWFRRPRGGVYLWGEVGRGKSFVMDTFFTAAPIPGKRRVHFHAFLQEIQRRLHQLSGQADPLAIVAREIAEQTPLLLFDEFHVHDIGDAMLLGRLLKVLLEEGVGMVCTSNYAPEKLCPNPLYRDRFKPAIALIEKHFSVLALQGAEDYRQRRAADSCWGSYHWPQGPDVASLIAEQLLVTPEALQSQVVEVNHRPVALQVAAQGRAWLSFDELFNTPRSVSDYLWLLERYPHMAVTGLDALQGCSQAVGQRFLNFIDIAYDRQVRLHLHADAPLPVLAAGCNTVDFERTLSRLQQLQWVQLVATPA